MSEIWALRCGLGSLMAVSAVTASVILHMVACMHLHQALEVASIVRPCSMGHQETCERGAEWRETHVFV